MSTAIQRRRGTTAQHASFAGLNGELTVDTDKKTVVVHDGATAGGFPLARQDFSNVSSLALPAGAAATPVYSFTGDTNTGIYSPGADQVAISTGGSGRLFVDASGRVGLGSSPTVGEAVTVGGSLLVKQAADTNGYVTIQGSNTYVSTATNLILGTNGSERLRVTSAGLIGVGTSSPGYRLDVTSQLGCTHSGAIRHLVNIDSDGGKSYWYNGTPTNTAYILGDTGNAYFAGNVGIGTSSPSENLTIYGASSRLAVTGGSGGSAILLGNQNASGVNNPSVILGANGSLYFGGGNSWSGGGTFDYTMTLTDDNKVGIGTQSPGSELVVTKSSGNVRLTVQGGTNGDGTLALAGAGTGIGKIAAWDQLVFGKSSGGAGDVVTEWGRWDASGRLLVGTSSDLSGGDADARLQVNGDGGAQILLSRQDFGALTAGTLIGEVVFRSQASGVGETSALIKCEADATQGSGDKPGRLVFSTTADGASSPTERMRITNGGNILLGSDNSSVAAEEGIKFVNVNSSTPYMGIVANTAGAGDTFYHYYNLNATYNGYRFQVRNDGGIANFSANNVNLCDEREKKNIENLDSTWDCLKHWELKKFNYNEDADTEAPRYGVIAQQVEPHCPEVITEWKKGKDDNGDDIIRMGVKEQQMYWMAIKALQEAQVRIEQLEAKVAALESA